MCCTLSDVVKETWFSPNSNSLQDKTMAFTHNSSAFFSTIAIRQRSGFVIAASILSAGLMLTAPAHASVLVDPAIRRSGSEAQSVPDTEADASIAEIATSTEGFSTLSAAIQAANLGGILASEGPYTVFAPTDAAFMALPPGALETLLLPENRDLLIKVLYNHVGYGDFTSERLSAGSFSTFDGTVDVAVTPMGVRVEEANVVQADIAATNGVIHAVDQVLLPVGFVSQLEARINNGADVDTTSSMSAGNDQATEAQNTRITTLQETAIDRSIAPEPVAPAEAAVPVAPAEATVPQPEPAATQEPVRGLW
ncbi:MAG: putative surface protein [Phormidesmis priestleyi Ana]|uniref:Putative surface protein n=1 Tax=Phormidesmis priestleyi Ana TaxID=1666911 RepID=A0A0P8BNV4_9CYAN|nr:MAG: putative surface protein [Phormidesmis priestleyi Ana]